MESRKYLSLSNCNKSLFCWHCCFKRCHISFKGTLSICKKNLLVKIIYLFMYVCLYVYVIICLLDPVFGAFTIRYGLPSSCCLQTSSTSYIWAISREPRYRHKPVWVSYISEYVHRNVLISFGSIYIFVLAA